LETDVRIASNVMKPRWDQYRESGKIHGGLEDLIVRVGFDFEYLWSLSDRGVGGLIEGRGGERFERAARAAFVNLPVITLGNNYSFI
jgi:hypothetical protein